MIITIDGPAGAGKSSAARALARRLGLRYLDTGAMFRAYTARALKEGVPLDDSDALIACIAGGKLELTHDGKVLMNGQDVSEAIRRPEVTRSVRHLASNPQVRERLLQQQRQLAKAWGSLVCDGRDTGTVVFPNADVKFFLDAAISERAQRRRRDLASRSITPPPREELEREIAERDASDRNRDVAPLAKAEDAILVDNSELDFDQTVELLASLIARRAG